MDTEADMLAEAVIATRDEVSRAANTFVVMKAISTGTTIIAEDGIITADRAFHRFLRRTVSRVWAWLCL